MKKIPLSNSETVDLICALNHYIDYYIKANNLCLDYFYDRVDGLVSLKEKLENV